MFLKAIKHNPPSFATYFTNHLAGMMHRYWRDLFPEDFNLESKDIDPFHSNSILKAMHIADQDLNRLLKLSRKYGYDIWVLSSMGQQAIDRGEYRPELYLKDFQKFLVTLGLKGDDFKLLPAMQPDYCIECSTKKDLNLLRNCLSDLRDTNGDLIILESYSPIQNRLNISLQGSKKLVSNEKLSFRELKFRIKDLGLELFKRDIGTAYHIPEGIMLSLGESNSRLKRYQNKTLDTTKICPTILDIFSIEIPNYMTEPL